MIEAGPQNGHRSDGNGHFPDDGRRVSSVGTPETDGRPDFSDVVRDHRDTLVRYVRRRKLELSPGSPDEEDVVQEALLKGWQGYQDFRGKTSVQNWLLAIARNEANDEIRRERRRPAIAGIEHGTLGDAVVAPEFRSTASDPAQVYENSQHIRNLIKLLTDIPYEQRRPLFMFGLGWSYKEIEWLLGLSPATVKWRIYKGREAIIKASEAEDFSGQAVPQAVGETAIKVELLSPA